MHTITPAALGVALVLTACTSTSEGATLAPSPAASSEVRTTLPAVSEEDALICPNPHGGSCLGPLEAGTYETWMFGPAIHYTVPDDTWANLEDLPGNFLLLRPQDPQDGVVGGSYVGIYQDVRAPDLACAEDWEEGVGHTPEELVDFYEGVPGLEVSTPVQVSVGGLTGYQLDFGVKRRNALCEYDGYPGTPLIIGGGVSELHHVVLPQLDVRLIVLGWQDANVTIEVTNVHRQYPARKWRALVRPILDTLRFDA